MVTAVSAIAMRQVNKDNKLPDTATNNLQLRNGFSASKKLCAKQHLTLERRSGLILLFSRKGRAHMTVLRQMHARRRCSVVIRLNATPMSGLCSSFDSRIFEWLNARQEGIKTSKQPAKLL